MNTDQVIERLRRSNRAEVSRATGIDYMHLSRVVWGKIKNPGSKYIDKLREHFESNPEAEQTPAPESQQ